MNEVVVTGAAAACGVVDPGEFLRVRKLRKFMGRQDDLAVTAAGRALLTASLTAPLGEMCGLYLAVGYIPFEAADMDQLLEASTEDGRFSMPRFASRGTAAINPLLTFRVLPNMPAFHVSLNFDVQGPYAVTYPGIGQFYTVLDDAVGALDAGLVDVALVGGVADQQNFLVAHHFSRIEPPVAPSRLVDAAAFLVLESASRAAARGATVRARLLDLDIEYEPVDPFSGCAPVERFVRDDVPDEDERYLGPASLAFAIAASKGSRMTHAVTTRDGFTVRSRWDIA